MYISWSLLCCTILYAAYYVDMTVTKPDIQEAAGSIQLCAGQISGIEAAVHAADSLFQQDDTVAIFLVDASNAFNSLNRLSALHNIRHLCPSLSTALINTYRAPTELFIDGDVLYSSEGTTQGDPLAMPMYALATIPLIRKLHSLQDDVSQVWYADDALAAGKLSRLHDWWSHIAAIGPKYGYFANPIKTCLITKEKHLATATTLFANTGVQVTSEGRPYLGAAIGTQEFVISHVQDRVTKWTKELDNLATIAVTQPHAAHAAFTHGLSSKWSYLSRTIEGISTLLQPLESVIRSKLVPTLTCQPPPNDELCALLALPARAYKQLGLLKRTFPTVHVSAKKNLYLSLVRSQLTYCSPVWRPQLLKHISFLEKVQRRSTKYILNDFESDYKSRLISLNLFPLMYWIELADIMLSIGHSTKVPGQSIKHS